jgi:hypothetical protein
MENIKTLLILNWLENHQVVAASLINVVVVLSVTFFTNRWQLQRESQKWQREKLYELYNHIQLGFSELFNSPYPPEALQLLI